MSSLSHIWASSGTVFGNFLSPVHMPYFPFVHCVIFFIENWVFQIFYTVALECRSSLFSSACCYWLLWLGAVHLFSDCSKPFFQRLNFLLCVVTEVSVLLWVVSQWPNRDILKFQEQKNKNVSWSLHIGSELGYSFNFKPGCLQLRFQVSAWTSCLCHPQISPRYKICVPLTFSLSMCLALGMSLTLQLLQYIQ